jgi:hypothetical protein
MKRRAIWLIIILKNAVRLWRIDAPFDDLWSWRQSDAQFIAALENLPARDATHLAFTAPQTAGSITIRSSPIILSTPPTSWAARRIIAFTN